MCLFLPFSRQEWRWMRMECLNFLAGCRREFPEWTPISSAVLCNKMVNFRITWCTSSVNMFLTNVDINELLDWRMRIVIIIWLSISCDVHKMANCMRYCNGTFHSRKSLIHSTVYCVCHGIQEPMCTQYYDVVYTVLWRCVRMFYVYCCTVRCCCRAMNTRGVGVSPIVVIYVLNEWLDASYNCDRIVRTVCEMLLIKYNTNNRWVLSVLLVSPA